MSRTIKRGTAPRRIVKGAPKRRGKPKASRLDRLMARLPVSEETLRRAATRGILALGGAAVPTIAGTPA